MPDDESILPSLLSQIRYQKIDRVQNKLHVVTVDASDRGLESILLIKPLAVGVCRSDIRELQNRRPERTDFGHEIVGRVVWARNVCHSIGDLVVLDPHVKLGYRSTAFGTLMEAHGSRASVEAAAIRFPSGAWTSLGFFVEPLACVIHCTNVVSALGSSVCSVRVVGAGTAGVLLAAVFALQGIRVWIANRSLDRLEFLRRAGFFDLGDIRVDAADRVDATIVATMNFQHGVSMINTHRDNGILVPYGSTYPAESWDDIDIDQIRRGERRVQSRHGVVQGSYGATYQDFELAQALIESSSVLRVVLGNLVTHRCDLSALPDLLARMAGGLRVSKALLTYS